MSLRRRSAIGAALLGALAMHGTRLDAQLPNVMAPKSAANRAAQATNAHTDAMTREQSKPVVVGSAASSGSRGNTAAAAQPGRPVASAPAPAKTASPAAVRSARADGAAPGAVGAAVTASTPAPGEKAKELSLMREAFTYEHESRRDPFVSLMATGELRPMISDLRLAAIIYDVAGRSVAILRDLSTKEQYRVKVGQAVGRMRVVQINPKSVTFTLEEFGYSRQEVLALPDPIKK